MYGVRLDGEREAVYVEEKEDAPSIERDEDPLEVGLFSGCVDGSSLSPESMLYNRKKKVLTIELPSRHPITSQLRVFISAGANRDKMRCSSLPTSKPSSSSTFNPSLQI
jgi:hypothetical protein